MRWSFLIAAFAMVFAFNSEAQAESYILLHGMGQTSGNADTAVDYWGGSKSSRSCSCTRRNWWGSCTRESCRTNPARVASYLGGSKYAPIHDTSSRGWDNRALQNTYVSAARRGGKVIAHSMGNPTLAGACYNGSCVNWRDSQGPVLGSDAANVSSTLCQSGWWSWNVGLAVRAFGYCTNAVFSMHTSRSEFANGTYRSRAKSRTSKTFCGDETHFWRSGKGAALSTVGNMVINGADDGLVPIWSCKIHNDSNVRTRGCDHEQGTGRVDNCGGIRNWMK